MSLLLLTPLCDLVRIVTKDQFWSHVAFYAVFAGAVSAVVAAIPGFIDWLALPGGSRAKRVGLMHLALNGTGVALAWVSALMRLSAGASAFAAVPFALTLLGAGLLVLGGWFGGELVPRLGIGVWPDAHPDAPSSLDEARLLRRLPTDRPAAPALPTARPTEPRPA